MSAGERHMTFLELRQAASWWIGRRSPEAHARLEGGRTVCGERPGIAKRAILEPMCPRCVALLEGREPPPPPPQPEPTAAEIDAPRTYRRSRASVNAAQVLKAQWVEEGRRACERCGFSPPVSIASRVLHAHHVYPVALGGTDAPENLVLLCPNCHALTHAVCRKVRRMWLGPHSRDVFFSWVDTRLKELETTEAEVA